MKTNTISIGCIVDHGRDTTEGTMVAVIDYATSKGFAVPSFLGSPFSSWNSNVDSMSTLSDANLERLLSIEDQAIDYLNENIAPIGHYFDHDSEAGAFGLWAEIVEED